MLTPALANLKVLDISTFVSAPFAAACLAEFGGEVPSGQRLLRTLPGIGPYTARAVQSFGFGKDVATVDTNAVRVLSRCMTGGPLSLAEAQTLADRLVPPGGSWEFNQTMFDVGATLCVGTAPRCGDCPLRAMCTWRRADLVEPDPWRASPSVRPQSKFAGSDRQGRGRLLSALRLGPLPEGAVAASCGWAEDVERATRIAQALVEEGFAEWVNSRPPQLRLR